MKLFLLFLLASVAAFLCCACQTQQTAAMLPAPTASVVTPSATPLALPLPSPTPTAVFAINPVSAFYSAYRQDTDAALNALYDSLAQKGDIASIDKSMALEKHCAAVNKARVSIGRLSQSGGAYADALLGAASGSGTLRADRNNSAAYHFRFVYDDTTLLQGTLDKDRLFASLHTTSIQETVTSEIDPETGEPADVVTQETVLGDTLCADLLSKDAAGAWLSCHYDGSVLSVLRVSGKHAVFHAAAPDANAPTLAQTDAETLLTLAAALPSQEEISLPY